MLARYGDLPSIFDLQSSGTKQPDGSRVAVLPTGCVERKRLDKLYAETSAKLSELLTELTRSAGSSENDTFEGAWAACKAQRLVCNEIVEQILDHIRLNRCAARPTQ